MISSSLVPAPLVWQLPSYAGRARMDTLIIEKAQEGGQIVITAEIENYPGGIDHESGPSLIGRMSKQAELLRSEGS